MEYIIENRKSNISAGNRPYLTPLPNIHLHLELIYITKGSSMAIVDNKEFLIEEGDIFLAFPNQIHAYHDQTSIERYLILFTPDMFEELKELFQSKIPVNPVIKSTHLHNRIAHVEYRFQKIMECYCSDSEFDKLLVKSYLLALLAELLPMMTFVPRQADHDSIKSILNYCSANYTNPLSLDIIAKDLHLNKYYISHIFKERMNMGLMDFINNLRTEHACSLLRKGVSITDVAFSCGFSTIRTFNRVFIRNKKMTPRDYIKAQSQ